MVGRLNFTVVWRILWAGSRRIIDMQILVPKQYSTGGKAKLAGISKRGNRYLRKILIHGARAVVLRSKRDRIAMGKWMLAFDNSLVTWLNYGTAIDDKLQDLAAGLSSYYKPRSRLEPLFL